MWPFGCHAAAAAARWSGVEGVLSGIGGRMWMGCLGMLRFLKEWDRWGIWGGLRMPAVEGRGMVVR